MQYIVYIYNIMMLFWYNKNNLIWCCQDQKYTRETSRPLGSLSRTKINKHEWQNNLLDHLVTVYCYSEIIILLHSNSLRLFGWGIIMKVYWIYLNLLLYLWYNSTDLILVLTMLYQEQKIYKHCNYHVVYVFVGNKNILSRTKIYGSKL